MQLPTAHHGRHLLRGSKAEFAHTATTRTWYLGKDLTGVLVCADRLNDVLRGTGMTKRERVAHIKSVWRYLQAEATKAFEAKDESEFDWYSDGLQAFWWILNESPISLTLRVRPLI